VAGSLYNKSIYIDDEGSLHYSDIIRRARRFYQEYKGLDLIVIDYLTLIRGDKENGRKDLEIGSITKALKGLAKELNIPIILLGQLNRELERRNNKRPILADLREAGAIEEDADIVIFIYRDDMYNKDPDNPKKGMAEILFAKHRNGPTGMIHLQWSETTATFHDLYQGEIECYLS
jgi:replicative DNA helicase